MSFNRKIVSSNFVDYVKVCAKSGDGGSGSAHLRREKYVPKGGPDGGDGGRGGHVIIRGNVQMWTLLPLKYRKHVRATDGDNGQKQRASGKQGEDMYMDVPLGTIIRDPETEEQLVEITEDGQEYILSKGGRGGLGNWNFKTSVKVVFFVFQNVVKSTLLSVVSAAKPEIANYQFTTLVPNLGIVKYRDHKSFVMADIPGIIEGAAEGKGLGVRFLRHIERNSVLLFLVPADADDIQAQYNILLEELRKYNPELMDKERVLAISKSDMLDQELRDEITKDLKLDIEWMFISSVVQEGLMELKDLLWSKFEV
jgi:GTP-binding protein